MRILFSIAVHESSESVNDLVLNIKHFCENPVILLHVSRLSNLSLSVEGHRDVFINRVQFVTGFADGTLSYVHYENFLEAERLDIDYDYFVPFGSNELFIRQGLERYIDSSLMSSSPVPPSHDFHYTIAKRDKALCKILDCNFHKSAPEGTFYHKEVLKGFFDRPSVKQYFEVGRRAYLTENGLKLRKLFCLIAKVAFRLKMTFLLPSYVARYSYASEELLMPSSSTANDVKNKFCFIPWEKDSIKVDVEDIINLLSSRENFYSVKRVEREVNDPIRKYIRVKLANNYTPQDVE